MFYDGSLQTENNDMTSSAQSLVQNAFVGPQVKMSSVAQVMQAVKNVPAEYLDKVMERAEKALKEDFVPGTPIERAIDYVTIRLTDKQKERVLNGKQVKLKSKMNLVIGIQQEYYDYSF